MQNPDHRHGRQPGDANVNRDQDIVGDHYDHAYGKQASWNDRYPHDADRRDADPRPIPGPHAGRGPKGYQRSEQQIVDEASQRLAHDGHVDATDIEVTVQDGTIHLRGTVPDRSSKRRAEAVVESVHGVRDVMNELRLAPSVSQ